jgi:4-hydroxy-tetrahydrodipicolinate synthase
MNQFTGTGVALITPFNSDLSVDYAGLTRLVEHNISNGTEYLVISGTTGESVTISNHEKKEITKHIIAVNNKRVPLVLGIGGNNTAAVVEEIKTTDLTAIDAILSVSPYYSKPTQEGMYQHFKMIAENCPTSVILYNVPGRTSKNMMPETILRLANDFDNIVAVKEASGDMSQYFQLIKNKPDNFHIISGDDDLALAVTLAGGSGVISVIGQAFPKLFSDMIRHGLSGNVKEGYKAHFELMEITRLIFLENNPAGIKAVLKALNICESYVRLPLVEATDHLKNAIAQTLLNLDKR